MSIFSKKKISEIMEAKSHGGKALKRTLGTFDLFLIGIGAIIGTGIFVLAGITAANLSGPAIGVSFMISGLTCILIALTYTEVATMIPSSGSAYSYAYVAIGELGAWIVFWIMTSYLLISSTTVASGWSGYVTSILVSIGYPLPEYLTKIPAEGGIINLPAVFISFMITLLLMRGTGESTLVNKILVVVKFVVTLLFVILVINHFDINNVMNLDISYDRNKFLSSNFTPFGLEGLMAGAGVLFFAYNGFDSIATAADETINPEKSMGVAIIASVIFSMLFYSIVSTILVGVVPYVELNTAQPMAYALTKIGNNFGSALVAAGAVAGMTTVIIFQTYSLTRILYVVSKDGLLPKIFSQVHPKHNSPHNATILCGILLMIIAGTCPLSLMGSISSASAIFSFMIVTTIMLILRKTHPSQRRPFLCPSPYLVSFLVLAICSYLIYSLVYAMPMVGISLSLWIVLGIVVYFVYVRNFSPKYKE